MIGAKLSRLVIERIRQKYGGYVVNVVVASNTGVADLIACIDGNFYAFEIKGHSDRPSHIQLEALSKVAKARGYGGLVHSIAELDDIIKHKRRPSYNYKKQVLSL